MSDDMDRRENDKKMYDEISNIKKDNSDMSQEIHLIKKKIEDVVNLMNSLVLKIGNVSVLENQQENDRDNIKNLAQIVRELTIEVKTLNTSRATAEGIDKGKRMVLGAISGLLGLLLVSIVTAVVAHNSKLGEHELSIRQIKADIKSLQERK